MNSGGRFFILFCLLALSSLYGQISIRGVVLNAHNKKPVADVNIYVQNTNIGTNSGKDGYFQIKIPARYLNEKIVFEHVSYDTLFLGNFRKQKRLTVYLTPRIIHASEIEVTSAKVRPHILKDIPQSISLIGADKFRLQGYIDGGDLLQTDQSIHVEETYSGKKTLTLRGGNPEDVLVLYNGIRLNNAYDNIFDFSLLNLDDVERIEIIKGSNTALYGAEAFSGIINILPKTHKDFTARFQQRIGTYASGDWNLQLNHSFFKRLNLFYTFKQAASKRFYNAADASENFTSTSVSYHNAGISYNFSHLPKDSSKQTATFMFLRSSQDYANTLFHENMINQNQLFSLRFTGSLWKWPGFTVTASYQTNERRQHLTPRNNTTNKVFRDKVFDLHLEQSLNYKILEMLFACQFENSNLDFDDDQFYGDEVEGIKNMQVSRDKYGLASILKFHIPTNSTFYSSTDFDLSYRADWVNNQFQNIIFWPKTANSLRQTILKNNKHGNWQTSVFKFAVFFSGGDFHHNINGFFNIGRNIKFPSMYQQISSPLLLQSQAINSLPDLKIERSRSFEIGVKTVQNRLSGKKYKDINFSLSYFRTYYNNKYRVFYLPGSPIAFYDNVPYAEISGFEAKAGISPLSQKISFDLGLSRYFISDKSAFPFKPDFKIVSNIFLDLFGFKVQWHGFSEDEQVGFVRDENEVYKETKLNGYANMDIHIKRMLQWRKFKFFANFSVRNLLEDKSKLSGLALRDRRYYVTFAIQY